MTLQGNDWLALTKEPTLEPEFPICDPHHHFWEYRPEPAAYQRYLLPELSNDLNSGHNVRSTAFIEVRSNYRSDGPPEMRPVGEVEFVEALAEASATGQYGPARAAAAIIGHADLNRCWKHYMRPVRTGFEESGTPVVGTPILRWKTGHRKANCPAPSFGRERWCWRVWAWSWMPT